MAIDDGVKIKIVAEDEASAAFEKLRETITGSFNDIDRAGGILSKVTDGISGLGVELGITSNSAGKFTNAMDRSAASASTLASEIATMVSGLKDLAASGKTLVESSWFKLVFSGMAVGSSAGGALGTIGTGALVRQIAPVAAAGKSGLGLSAAGPLGAIAYGLGAFGIDWYTDSINKQTERNALAPVGREFRDFHELLAAARQDIGEQRVRSITQSQEYLRLGAPDAYREAVREALNAERNRVAQLRSDAESRRTKAASDARSIRLEQSGMVAGEWQNLADKLLENDPVKQYEFRIRRQGLTDENQIGGLVQAYGDYLKQLKEATQEQEKQLRTSERLSDVTRQMANSAEAWKERALTSRERSANDLAELTVLFHTGQLDPLSFARNALSIRKQLQSSSSQMNSLKRLYDPAKASADFGGAPLIESFLGGGRGNDPAQQTRKMTLDEMKALRRESSEQARESKRLLSSIANKLVVARGRGL